MGRSHIKRISAPRTWPIKRKERKFTTRGFPNGQKKELTLPINIIIRDLFGFAKTAKEVRFILTNKKINLNGRRIMNHRKSVGFLDVLSFPELKESYRLLLNEHNKLFFVKEKEDKIKIIKLKSKIKIKNSKTQKNKIQFGFDDGMILLMDEKDAKTYKINDSCLIEFGEKLKIKQHIPFEKGKIVFIVGGKYVGKIGKIKDIIENNVVVETKDKKQFRTAKRYGLVVGDDKSLITLISKE